MALPASIQQVVALYKYLGHLRPTLVLTSLLRRFVFFLKVLRSKWQTWYRKQQRLKPPSSNAEPDDEASEHSKETNDINANQTVIPHDSISYSLYPYGTGLHDGSRSSQILNASRSSHNLGIVSRSRNTSFCSHNVAPNHARSPNGDEYTFNIQPSSPRRTYSMSSPELARPRATNLHEAILHHRPFLLSEPRSDSPVESLEILPPGEISSLHSRLPASGSPIEQFTENPSQIHMLSDDLEIPSLDHHRIYPVAPEHFQRYEKRRRIPSKETRVKMKPMVINFSDRLDPPGWTLCTHPEGACYFYNAEKRIFTDVDLYDSAFFKRIVLHIGIIETFISSNHIPIPEETDLVLDINLDANGTYVTDYYFANHQLRTVFFLDHFSSEYLPNWEEIKGVSSGRHLQHEMEAQYWHHCLTYPNSLQLSNDLVCELRDVVMHSIGDMMTSPYAISPYALEELYKILILRILENHILDALAFSVSVNSSGPVLTSLIILARVGRLMFVFTHMKFLHFHGQPEARLNRDQSVYGTRTNRRTWFIKTISIFLFSAPDVHLKILQKMWVDGLMHKAVWETSLKKVNDEWREFILYATVLLNANVAFLGNQNPSPNRTPAQISSYCSVVTSIGSIIIGLLLVRQNQTKNRDTAVDAQRFLRDRAHPLLGLEILAIMFSLPYALLMWSMVSFLAAFLFSCFQDSSNITRTVIAPLCGVIAILIVWCIWTSWEKHPPSDAETPEDSLSFENDSEQISNNFTFEVVKSEPTEEPQRSVMSLRLPHLFTWPAFLQRRRQSYDSNRTVVEDP